MIADVKTDSANKMKNMIQVRNSKNTWPVLCVEIIVSFMIQGCLLVGEWNVDDLRMFLDDTIMNYFKC